MKNTIFAAGIAASAIAACFPAKSPAGVAPIRLAYNYCTLSYTFAYYSDEAWAGEVDRLAKAGYNTALVIDGTFKVWQATLAELGYPDEEIAKFIPDECTRAWWLMANLTGEDSGVDAATVEEDGKRGRYICSLMREKGIEPVLQGFTGMMPLGTPGAIAQGEWSVYERPPMLDPTGEEFARVAEVWYRNLEKVYGFKPKYLAGDLFHEGGRTAGIDVTEAVRKVQQTQQKAFPGVTWIVQAWQGNPTREVRAGLDPRFTLIEALVKDMGAFTDDDSVCNLGFDDLPWIWCEVLNFGGNHGLYGNLKTYSRIGRAAKSATFRGYGALSEGFFTNPVCQDLFEDMMMREAGSELSAAELAEWLRAWIAKRYGVEDGRISEAWRILARTVYNCSRCQEGTVENVLCAYPSLEADNASTWGPRGGLWYSAAELERALGLFVSAAGDVSFPDGRARENFMLDKYDLERQVRANRMRALLPFMGDIPDKAQRENARAAFLREAEWFANADGHSVPESFRLGTYLAQARARGGERAARAFCRMVTTWTGQEFQRTTLSDYANREYPELVREYYLPRWKRFLGDLAE